MANVKSPIEVYESPVNKQKSPIELSKSPIKLGNAASGSIKKAKSVRLTVINLTLFLFYLVAAYWLKS